LAAMSHQRSTRSPRTQRDFRDDGESGPCLKHDKAAAPGCDGHRTID
jgi:hypothetical protein